jgi:hypothetical protein
MQDEAGDEGENLFSVVMFHDGALEATLRDLVTLLGSDREAALQSLLNLVLATAGCPGKLSKDAVSDLEDVSQTLFQLQSQVNVVRSFS